MDFLTDPRFKNIQPFDHKVWLSSPTMHGDEQRWVDEAIQTNWVSTVGANINEVEKQVAEKIGRKYAVALSSGTAALHLAIRLCGEKLYGPQPANKGVLEGHKVMTVYVGEIIGLGGWVLAAQVPNGVFLLGRGEFSSNAA